MRSNLQSLNFWSNSNSGRWLIVCTFSIHLLLMPDRRISSQLYSELHNSCKSILNLIATGNKRSMGSHNWPTRPRQRLFVRTPYWLSSVFFRVNFSVCFFCVRPSRSVNCSPLNWSISAPHMVLKLFYCFRELCIDGVGRYGGGWVIAILQPKPLVHSWSIAWLTPPQLSVITLIVGMHQDLIEHFANAPCVNHFVPPPCCPYI